MKIYLSRQIEQSLLTAWYDCEDFKNLSRGTSFDKFLHDKVFNIAKNTKMTNKRFDKTPSGGAVTRPQAETERNLLLKVRLRQTCN